jgi:predicted nucleic acid-binding protein
LKVVLLVPDAGPLISLAKADCLDLLLLLELPVVLVDQVQFEVTRHKQFADAVRIEQFVQSHAAEVHVFATAVGAAAAVRRTQGEVRQPGQGEAAIAELLQRLDEVNGDADAPVLLLYEDSDVRKSRFVLPDNVHVVSTSGLLAGLERKGLIRSAEAVWERIEAAGRVPSSATVDQPGAVARRSTSW